MYLCVCLIIILIFLIIYYLSQTSETFNLGIGKSFSQYYTPQSCNINDNCFKGSLYRTQLYENMCEPNYGNLLREKIPLNGNCLRTLGNNLNNMENSILSL